MIFSRTKIGGAYIIDPELIHDERGFFARSFCKEEFQRHGIDNDIVQCNISCNTRKGTLRGLHYQTAPFEETKIVSCTKGSVYDVIVDLRKDSPTYCSWFAEILSGSSLRMIYIPKGCAHGFQTLEDHSVVYYQMGEYYHPECAKGIRWNDPSFGITWPIPDMIISEKDKKYMNFLP